MNPLIAHSICDLLLCTSVSYRVTPLSSIVSLHMLCPLAAPILDSRCIYSKEAVEKNSWAEYSFWYRNYTTDSEEEGKKFGGECWYQIILSLAGTQSNTNNSVACYTCIT